MQGEHGGFPLPFGARGVQLEHWPSQDSLSSLEATSFRVPSAAMTHTSLVFGAPFLALRKHQVLLYRILSDLFHFRLADTHVPGVWSLRVLSALVARVFPASQLFNWVTAEVSLCSCAVCLEFLMERSWVPQWLSSSTALCVCPGKPSVLDGSYWASSQAEG